LSNPASEDYFDRATRHTQLQEVCEKLHSENLEFPERQQVEELTIKFIAPHIEGNTDDL
jgi:hypothetical protein